MKSKAIICPSCGAEVPASMFHKMLGHRTSELKKQSSRENGKLGGRPKKTKNESSGNN